MTMKAHSYSPLDSILKAGRGMVACPLIATVKRLPGKGCILDLLVSFLLLLATLFYAWKYVSFNIPPFEDAAILMRYADHFARGYGIVWNVGEPPVDGATDFLFMVVVGYLARLGLPLSRAVRGVGFISHLASVLLIYWVNRRVWKASAAVSAFSALYLAFGTGLAYVAAFFGTPFFAFSAALTWTLALLLMQQENQSLRLALSFALSGLVTGLIRPEGVILASLMLLAVIVRRGLRNSWVVLLTFLAVFLLFGGAYFWWRWSYFGHPLPNPFYKKGGGGLHWDAFYSSLKNTLRLCAPFAFAYLLGLRSRKTLPQTVAFLLPVLGFASAFVLISDEMNYGARFQYALVPIVLLSWVPPVKGLKQELHFTLPGDSLHYRIVLLFSLLGLAGGLLYYSWFQNCFLTPYQKSCAAGYEADGRFELAKMLSEYKGKGYVMATSEAGLLPFYSRWTAIDTWGLNDPWIVRNGGVSEEYLDRYRPHLIVFHAYFSPLVPPKINEKNMAQDWFRMTIILKEYAEKRGYILAAVFGDSPYDTHYYYVRPDFPDSKRIVRQISEMKDYYYFTSGKKAINYAIFASPGP